MGKVRKIIILLLTILFLFFLYKYSMKMKDRNSPYVNFPTKIDSFK